METGDVAVTSRHPDGIVRPDGGASSGARKTGTPPSFGIDAAQPETRTAVRQRHDSILAPTGVIIPCRPGQHKSARRTRLEPAGVESRQPEDVDVEGSCRVVEWCRRRVRGWAAAADNSLHALALVGR